MADIVVVGAGQTGVCTARFLAQSGAAVTLVERLPAPGGQEPEPAAHRLAREALDAGVTPLFGTLAVEWRNSAVITLGVQGTDRLPCRALVIASGTRPATRGEMGIAGDRCAGIIPGSAAIHLTESGVLLGRHPVVTGGGGLASKCASLVLEAGAEQVTVVAEDGVRVPPLSRARMFSGTKVVSVHGPARVAAVVLERQGYRERILADALILASGRVPMRNVEGAVMPAPGVVFAHSSADPKQLSDAEKVGRRAAEEALKLLASSHLDTDQRATPRKELR